MVRTRKELAIFLSKLKTFEEPDQRLEQYSSDGDSAATLLWQAMIDNNIDGKTIIDLGSGTGILGIGALLLGAKKIFFVDIDAKTYNILKQNLEILTENWEIDLTDKWEFINSNVKDLNLKTKTEETTVITNPPFGTTKKHADKDFLEASKKLADEIYSMHKTNTEEFIQKFCKTNELKIIWAQPISFQLKNTLKHHKKHLQRVEVTIFHIKKS